MTLDNPIIEKVAKALQSANEELYAILKFNVKDHTWEIWVDSKPYLVNIKSHDDAETACEGLNYRYAARKAIEAMTEITIKLPAPKDGHGFTILNNTSKEIKIIP